MTTERNNTNPRCLCGAARVDEWTAGVHHGAHRCARVITRLVEPPVWRPVSYFNPNPPKEKTR